jgi:hypothetical protein
MKCVFAGPRDFDDFAAWCALTESCPWVDAIEQGLSGACRLDEAVGQTMPPFAKGADGLAERWALARGIPVVRYYPKWRIKGRSGIDRGAGPKRNRLMAEIAEALIAIPNAPPYPHSGTWNMIAEGVRHGLEIWVPQDYRGDVMVMEAFALSSPGISASALLERVMTLETPPQAATSCASRPHAEVTA